MEITVAKTAGFCFGVNRAVDLAFECARSSPKVCTLGPIIHNPQLVAQLEAQGVRAVDDLSDVPDDAVVIIRSHGVTRQIYDEIAARKLSCVDATCPFVAKIHRIVQEKSAAGSTILIAGDREHPEVQGIFGHCTGPVYFFKTADELLQICYNTPNICEKSCCMVAQTTFHTQEWENCVESAKKVCTNLEIFDTICIATVKRQEEARELAQKSDLMIVVGGRTSSNTAKLFQICREFTRSILVERAQELYDYNFAQVAKVGVTAGASTPACIIKEVRNTMSEILKNQEEEASFEELLDQSFKSTYNGKKETGVVVGIAPNELQVDIGTKHAGYVPISEFTDDPNAKLEDLVKKGDEIELLVVRVNDVEGTVMLSKKRLDQIAGQEKIENAYETGEVLDGVVVEVVKGGVIVQSNGARIFVPASKATLSRNEELESLLKKEVQFKVIDLKKERGRKRAIGSIKDVVLKARAEAAEKFWADVEVGKTYTGEVKSLTSYGAFVDLGGVDGMVHISELSWSRIKHPSEVVKVGDMLEVYVKDIDRENKKISLGFKKAEDNPWEIIKRDYPVGSVATVKIVSITTFGAFAQIIPGVDGLIHISQISFDRVNKVSDVLSVGDEVQVKITEIDFEKKRISLSMKALLEPEAEEAAAEEAPAEAEEAAPVEE
ncbi:bifunctional 4-hydroxy-3-methylbut-2-enyl diphosphate reductase/30S ribosomal protein S1 [Clostridiaceae bacterium NSJ-31]|uniref:4-hydroxy-3-methylbut-2-enyl diphosphate reductase n=1 Tax=Ligaoa zhengdingensis TaxID=2763658 RepID=A0A926DY77_9FIRM|nr:bifunctional 4-hydroxy-3-methylbut-2-enyl diphosphate reductase/30S ribosomal protein S1 [Ligaoa zhengdingensis]MBC8545385.1 bifunctional 4-hydroxy-3-methylbut-2-enyl diphosphate reductase/30S ribosomal protein S1 [Ligaoa zhengdingensis]